jgi:hypothetical protein
MDKTPLDVEPDEIPAVLVVVSWSLGAAAAISGGLWKWLNSWFRIDGLMRLSETPGL